jgi:hypothetical protein
MSLPPWADAGLSAELTTLCAAGEGQHLEYKASFPPNIQDLAKEIAAFATSGKGQILVGVDRSGAVVGLSGIASAAERDLLLQRIQGICSGVVAPSISIGSGFAVTGNTTILVLNIPKGPEPIYYVKGRPYLRHITESRLAEPHEVVQLVRSWIAAHGNAADHLTPQEKFLLDLSGMVSRIRIVADEADQRQIDPGASDLRDVCGEAASGLRRLAASSVAVSERVEGEIRNLADAADQVKSYRPALTSKGDLDRLVLDMKDQAEALSRGYLASRRTTERQFSDGNSTLLDASRRLTDLVRRLDKMAETNGLEEAQAEAAGIGGEALFALYSGVSDLSSAPYERLCAAAHDLQLTGFSPLMTPYGDEVIKRIRSAEEVFREQAPMLSKVVG